MIVVVDCHPLHRQRPPRSRRDQHDTFLLRMPRTVAASWRFQKPNMSKDLDGI